MRSERLVQIYNGVDHQRFSPRHGERPNVLPEGFAPASDFLLLGTVGRLVEVKDQALILALISVTTIAAFL